MSAYFREAGSQQKRGNIRTLALTADELRKLEVERAARR
jgi:hypothetical protein